MMSDVTDYEIHARESQIKGFESGERKDLASMTPDEKLTEILWILRQGEDAIRSQAKNPMVKMALGI